MRARDVRLVYSNESFQTGMLRREDGSGKQAGDKQREAGRRRRRGRAERVTAYDVFVKVRSAGGELKPSRHMFGPGTENRIR